MDITNLLHYTDITQFREWLLLHAATEKVCWLILSNPTCREAPLYLDAVEQALCFGWIDSTKKRTPEGLFLQRFSPRSKSSNWTELNKERVRRLERLGLMTKLGRASLPDLSPDSFQIDPEILTALQADPIVWEQFQQLPSLYVRIRIYNIQSHKGVSDLYQKRLTKFIEATRQGNLYGDWNDGGRL